MFKFNFNQDAINQDANQEDSEELKDNFKEGDEKKCVEHKFFHEKYDCAAEVIEVLGLKHINSAEVIDNMNTKPEFLKENSDLVKNGELVYNVHR